MHIITIIVIFLLGSALILLQDAMTTGTSKVSTLVEYSYDMLTRVKTDTVELLRDFLIIRAISLQ